MEFRKRFDRIWLEDETGREIAFVSFPARDRAHGHDRVHGRRRLAARQA